jgi:hypothetical protein
MRRSTVTARFGMSSRSQHRTVRQRRSPALIAAFVLSLPSHRPGALLCAEQSVR